MIPQLKQKFDTYTSLIKQTQDSNGFIQSDKCDSLLFSGLVGSVPNVTINIDAAYDRATGTWHRRPTCCPSCYPTESKSTISRDMFIGLAWYCYYNKRLDIVEQIIKYALSHWLIMGKGEISRTLMVPGLLSTYAWISYRLGGPSRPWLRYIPQFESKIVKGFEAHLSILHIMLRNKLTGKEACKDIIKMHAERQPNNPLFLIADGQRQEAIKILMDGRYWPDYRLPTEQDRSEPWLPERDYGKDWLPDKNGTKTHSGGDFIFCAALALDLL